MGATPDPQLTGPIEIRPEVTMLSVLRHLNYKAWFAIAEFIDNALQSYLGNRAALEAIHGPDFRLEVAAHNPDAREATREALAAHLRRAR